MTSYVLRRPNGAWDIPRDVITRCSIGAWPGILFGARLPPETAYEAFDIGRTALMSRAS